MVKSVCSLDLHTRGIPDSPIAKRKREEEKAKKEIQDKGISNYFTKGPAAAQPKPRVISLRMV